MILRIFHLNLDRLVIKSKMSRLFIGFAIAISITDAVGA